MAKQEKHKAEHATATGAVETASAAPAREVATPPAKGKTVKVEFLRSHPEFGHFIGDQADISREAFDRIQKDGPFFKEL